MGRLRTLLLKIDEHYLLRFHLLGLRIRHPIRKAERSISYFQRACGFCRDAVIGLIFAANAMMTLKKPLWVDFALDLQQPSVVCSPEGQLPIRFKVVCFVGVTSCVGHPSSKDVYRRGHLFRGCFAFHKVGFVSGYTPKSLASAGDDNERSSIIDSRIHRSLSSPFNRLAGSP